jgi:aminodeoxyfutalosine synthase
MEGVSAPLTDLEAEAMLGTPDLIEIGVRGDEVRRRLHGTRTTFLRVLEVHVEAAMNVMPAHAVAGEIRIIGRPPTLDCAVTAVKAARAAAGDTPVTGFSLDELHAFGASLEAVSGALHDAGLDALSEVRVDLFSEPAAVDAVRRGGLRVERMTVNAPVEGGALLDLLRRARDLHAHVGGFRVFAPLPRTAPIATPTTGYDDVKAVALARVMLPSIPSIQVDWALYGPKLAQVVLTMGADDVDGVSAVEPGVLGTRRTALEEIKGNIRSAGLEPVERNGRYESI